MPDGVAVSSFLEQCIIEEYQIQILFKMLNTFKTHDCNGINFNFHKYLNYGDYGTTNSGVWKFAKLLENKHKVADKSSRFNNV